MASHIQPQLSRMCAKYIWISTSPNANGALPYWGFRCYVDGLVQKRCTSIADTLELCLSCTHPSMLQQAMKMWKSYNHHTTNSHVIDCIQQVCHCLPRSNTSTTYAISVWSNDAFIDYIQANACTCHQISNVSHTKSQNLNLSHLILQLSLPNSLKPGVKSRMKR